MDYSTGNINFIGSVYISGDVKSGFTVKAQDDVEIDGIVEDAVIEAGGKVLLKSGFVGSGEGKITAEGKVIVKFCENEVIISGDDVIIGDFVMHSTINTKGSLVVTENKGLIVGGDIFALKGVEAKIIGNQNFTQTQIYVGIDKEINEKITEKRSTLLKNNENKTEIDKAILLLMKRKLLKKKLSKDKKDLLKKLEEVKEKLNKDEIQINLEIKELYNQLEEYKTSLVTVSDVVYPGTSITIFDIKTAVMEAIKDVKYKYSDQGIIVLSRTEET